MCNTTAAGNDLGLTDKNHACTCGTSGHTDVTTVQTDSADDHAEAPIREHYLVDGMTCSHCVASVTEEVSALEGVQSVSVDLNAGGTSRIMVVSSSAIPTEDIRTAVTEAGYALVAG